jgi:acetylornithine aminotransferase
MLEPIQGEGGVNVPSPGYFQEVRRICDKHDLILIFDEVQVGMGRTGKLFAHEHFDIVPDIMTLAKALAGGAPIGTMLATDCYAAAFVPGTHGSTFGGNPLVCAAAIATVRAILEDGILNRCEEIGEYLEGELQALQRKYPFVKEVRGIGLMIGMALDIPAGEIVKKGHERGVLLNVTHDTVLRFVPPLTVTKQEINQMIAILDGIFAETEV